MPDTSSEIVHKSWVSNLFEIATVLLRNWKVVAAGSLIPAIIACIGVLMVDSDYRASSTVVVPSMRNGLSALSALSSSSGLGSLLGGGMNNPVDPRMESLLMSERLADAAIRAFRLDTVWQIKPGGRWETTQKIWNTNFGYELDANYAIKFGFIDRSPERSAAVVNFCVKWLDSSFQALQRDQAERNLKFLESITAERMGQLKGAEDTLVRFQTSNRLWVPTEQIKQSVIQAAGLEADLQKLDLQIQLGESNGKSPSSLSELKILKERSIQKLSEFTDGARGPLVRKKNPSVLLELNAALDKELAYERLYRQILIHGEVLKFLVQQTEQARIESQKTVSVLQVIDPAKVPQQRHSPKRGQLVEVAFILAFLMTSGAVLATSHFRKNANEDDWRSIREFASLFRRSRA